MDDDTTTLDNQGRTNCCGSYPTYHDMLLCCRTCWKEVIE